jgi:hypothetical protein
MPYPEITTTQQFLITLTPMTGGAHPKPAPVDGDPVWAISDESVASIVPVTGTLTAEVVAQAPGSYTVSASVDADMGTGVRTLVYQDSGTVILGEAMTLGATLGPVEEQP